MLLRALAAARTSGRRRHLGPAESRRHYRFAPARCISASDSFATKPERRRCCEAEYRPKRRHWRHLRVVCRQSTVGASGHPPTRTPRQPSLGGRRVAAPRDLLWSPSRGFSAERIADLNRARRQPSATSGGVTPTRGRGRRCLLATSRHLRRNRDRGGIRAGRRDTEAHRAIRDRAGAQARSRRRHHGPPR